MAEITLPFLSLLGLWLGSFVGFLFWLRNLETRMVRLEWKSAWAKVGSGVLSQIESGDVKYYEDLKLEEVEKFLTDLSEKPESERKDKK